MSVRQTWTISPLKGRKFFALVSSRHKRNRLNARNELKRTVTAMTRQTKYAGGIMFTSQGKYRLAISGSPVRKNRWASRASGNTVTEPWSPEDYCGLNLRAPPRAA